MSLLNVFVVETGKRQGRMNENTHPETLNAFKTGVSLLPSSRGEGILLRGRTGSVELKMSFPRQKPRGVFCVVTAPRHVWSARASVKNQTPTFEKACLE